MIRLARPSFGAIFDWDGVIIDSARLHEQSWRQLAKELGKSVTTESFVRGFGMKSAQIIATIHKWSSDPKQVSLLADRKEELYRELVAKSDIQPLPGVVEWLQRLHEAKVPCAVASSTQRANIEAVLHRIGLDKAFSAIVSAEDVSHGKPAPDVFLIAAAKLKVEARSCIVFEDAHVGIEAGHAAGMKVIAVATTHVASELGAADLVVRRLDHLSLEQATELVR